MNDVVIFGMGCVMSLIVASAVGLLLWGAAHEPHEGARQGQAPRAPEPRPQPRPEPRAPEPASVESLGSQSPA